MAALRPGHAFATTRVRPREEGLQGIRRMTRTITAALGAALAFVPQAELAAVLEGRTLGIVWALPLL